MIRLTLTDEQAKIVSIATEFYSRVRIGQFNEIIWHTLDLSINTEEFCQRRDKAEHLLFAARKQLYPELNGIGHSFGMGKFKDADMSFDVYQVIRHAMGDDRTPFSYYELPKCEVVRGADE